MSNWFDSSTFLHLQEPIRYAPGDPIEVPLCFFRAQKWQLFGASAAWFVSIIWIKLFLQPNPHSCIHWLQLFYLYLFLVCISKYIHIFFNWYGFNPSFSHWQLRFTEAWLCQLLCLDAAQVGMGTSMMEGLTDLLCFHNQFQVFFLLI